MKTKNLSGSAFKMASLFVLFLSCYNVAQAQFQMQTKYGSKLEVEQAHYRLDAVMNSMEQSARYVAPSVEDAELELLKQKLEVFTANLERTISYRPPVVEEENQLELEANSADEPIYAVIARVE